MSTDPFLALADHDHAESFTLAGQTGRVIPQRIEAGSKRHHASLFYVELPSDGGPFYQIDAAKLARVMGDGGATRHFKARIIAQILRSLSSRINPHALLKSVSI